VNHGSRRQVPVHGDRSRCDRRSSGSSGRCTACCTALPHAGVEHVVHALVLPRCPAPTSRGSSRCAVRELPRDPLQPDHHVRAGAPSDTGRSRSDGRDNSGRRRRPCDVEDVVGAAALDQPEVLGGAGRERHLGSRDLRQRRRRPPRSSAATTTMTSKDAGGPAAYGECRRLARSRGCGVKGARSQRPGEGTCARGLSTTSSSNVERAPGGPAGGCLEVLLVHSTEPGGCRAPVPRAALPVVPPRFGVDPGRQRDTRWAASAWA